MREVCIIGAGMTELYKAYNGTLGELGCDAVREAIRDAGIDPRKIEAGYVGNSKGGSLVGQRVFKDAGLSGIPVINVSNACSSGATALREAWVAVSAGLYDMAIVVGCEKMSDLGGGLIPLTAEDIEVGQGLSMPGVYAMRAVRYMADYGATPEDFAAIAVKNKGNGSLNPYARLRKPVTLEEVLNSKMVAYPLTMLECCPNADAAASVIICDAATARKYTTKPVRILSTSISSGKFINGFRDSKVPEITERCVAKAYAAAGIGPEDVDTAEVHDAFAVSELLYYEALGFCGHGEGVKFLRDGHPYLGGSKPVSPSGGLLSRGHPIGATGVLQLVEMTWQLRGQCGARQVENAKIALCHCTGGGIWGYDHGACTISILGI